MNNLLLTYIGVGLFLLGGLIFALLVKPTDKKHSHDKL